MISIKSNKKLQVQIGGFPTEAYVQMQIDDIGNQVPQRRYTLRIVDTFHDDNGKIIGSQTRHKIGEKAFAYDVLNALAAQLPAPPKSMPKTEQDIVLWRNGLLFITKQEVAQNPLGVGMYGSLADDWEIGTIEEKTPEAEETENENSENLKSDV
jgi:hypothetical protein